MARPIETDDDGLLDAADRVLMTEGPAAFTLARAGAEAGVSAATYIKRFGSKQQLFVRLSQRWVASLDHVLAEAAAPFTSPLERLRAAALCNYRDLDHPATASKQLAALAVDLQHDEMRALLHAGWSHVRRHLARHAAAAAAAGELAAAPSANQKARIIVAAMEGGCLTWSVNPVGSLLVRLRSDLDALLAGWTPSARRARSRRARPETSRTGAQT